MTKTQSLLLCPRRTFLASVILASKFLQNKCYSNCAWAKLLGCIYIFIFSYSFYFYFLKVSWVQVMFNHVTYWNININKFKHSSWTTTTFTGTMTTRMTNGHHVTIQMMGKGQGWAKTWHVSSPPYVFFFTYFLSTKCLFCT